jgi:hsp70-interacting protein
MLVYLHGVDMDKLGGLVAVTKELEDIESEIRTTSAWVLGKASQNNAFVQNQVSYYFLYICL